MDQGFVGFVSSAFMLGNLAGLGKSGKIKVPFLRVQGHQGVWGSTSCGNSPIHQFYARSYTVSGMSRLGMSHDVMLLSEGGHFRASCGKGIICAHGNDLISGHGRKPHIRAWP